MIAGGSEAIIIPLCIAGFCQMKAMSTRNDDPARASRPFDAGRDGFVCGEGGGIVLLESLEHAVRRGARIYAEVAGYGMTSDAHHLTAPDPEGDGAARAMAAAMSRVAESRDLVERLGAEARVFAESFTWERAADQTEAHLSRVISSKANRA